ncbi:hypothetical protein [Amycolatopsis sp. cmx-4-54]|uniref:hypothetical protein n=1 Tax=Amycolatopsis sp. cmx-4-54 TaxID=2790936 RepID=UPI003978C459
MKHATPIRTNEDAERLTRSVDAFAHLVASLRRIKRKQAKLAEERKQHEAVIKAALVAADAEVGTVNGVPVVSFVRSLKVALDQGTLKDRYPEIAEECAGITEVATFRLLNA